MENKLDKFNRWLEMAGGKNINQKTFIKITHLKNNSNKRLKFQWPMEQHLNTHVIKV